MTLPWWGWLIAACVAMVVLGWITITVVGTRTVARQMQADREADERRRPGRLGVRW